MRRIWIALGLVWLAVNLGGPAMAGPLDAVRWQKRVLMLFGDGVDMERQASAMLADRKALAERQMLVLRIGRDVVALDGGTAPPNASADALRRAYGPASAGAFKSVLVGLDGGVKWQGDASVDAGTVFGVIDSMPMRRRP